MHTYKHLAQYIKESEDKMFISKKEKDKFNEYENILRRKDDSYSKEDVKIMINDVIEKLEDKEDKIIKNTAFNKSFGTGIGTVAEGSHSHISTDLKFLSLEKNLGVSDSINLSTKDIFTDITPSSKLWGASSSSKVKDTIIEDNRFEFSTEHVDHGLNTSTLTDLIDIVKGKEITLCADAYGLDRFTIYVKMYNNDGWSFLKLADGKLIGNVKVPEDITDFKLAIENKSTSNNKVVVKGLKLYLKNEYVIESNTDIPDRNFSIWSWHDEEILDPKSTMEFCKRFKINRIYQHISTSNIRFRDIRKFTKVLQENGVMVNWLVGDPKWATTDKQSCMNAILNLADYNNSVNNEYEKIGTIQLDVEPQALPDWGENEVWVLDNFMEMTKMAYELCQEYNLSLNMCVPAWLDGKTYDNKYGTGNVYDFISKHSNTTTLMSYNKKAYLSLSEDELRYGKKNNRAVAIGLETQELSNLNETFFGEPIELLYEAFEEIRMMQIALGISSKYEFVIHDYTNFKEFVSNFPDMIIEEPNRAENILTTSDKTIVGAINEINAKITRLFTYMDQVANQINVNNSDSN